MSEKSPEISRYTKEEALQEAEMLTSIVEHSKGMKDYDDAERRLKVIGSEVRPPFNEEEFNKVQNAIDKLISWDLEKVSEERRQEEIKQNLALLVTNKAILVNAYDYKNSLPYYITRIANGWVEGGGEDDQERFKEFGLEVITDLVPKIVKDSQRDGFKPWSLEMINLLARCPHIEKQKLGIDTLVGMLDVIEKGFVDQKNSWRCFYALDLINEKGNEEQRLAAAKTAIRVAARITDQERYGKLIGYLFKNQSPEIMAEGIAAVNSTLEQYNLPLDFIDVWKKSGPKLGEIVESNIDSIIQLEHRQKGVCRFLYNEFGIADFGRYPEALLLRQYKDVNSLENPYGVIIFPRNDWNGSFYDDKYAFERLYQRLEELGGGFSLRVVECHGKISIARALIKLKRRYNPPGKYGHKISLGVIGGHGTENSILFGGESENDTLYIEDLMGKGVQRTSEFFEEHPTIILASCSTGVESGIGQRLSEVMGAKVIAPRIPANIREIQVGKRRGGSFRFNAKYSGDDKK